MKIFLVSQGGDEIDDTVDELSASGASVVAREVHSYEELSGMVAEGAKKGIYDAIVAITSDSLRASMELNKHYHINAAQCASVKDVQEAMELKANVMLIRQNEKDIEGMLEEIARVSAHDGSALKKEKQNEQEEKDRHLQVKDKKEEKQEHKEENNPPYSGKGGLFGKLKYSLGIMDDK